MRFVIDYPESVFTEKKQEEQQKTHAHFIQLEFCEVFPAASINNFQKDSIATGGKYRYYAGLKAVCMRISYYTLWLIFLSNAGGTILSITYGLDVQPRTILSLNPRKRPTRQYIMSHILTRI